MVSVAILTALAVDLAYTSQVSLRIAANGRSALQATYLGKSGVAVSRLVLAFQQEVDEAGRIPGAAVPVPRLQLWRLAPVGSELADALLGGAPPSRLAAEGAAQGPASGTFDVDIQDEGAKINLQLDALGTNVLLGAQLQAIWQLVCDPRWDPLFDREDANGLRVTRPDLLVYLRDWVDPDAASSALGPRFAPIGCALATPQSPFEPGFGDENFPYDRGEERYRAKNAKMDSLDELLLVAGIGDAFMAAFGDAITVYLPRDAKQGTNTTDPRQLLLLAQIMADPQDNQKLADPAFQELFVRLYRERTFNFTFALGAAEIGQLVMAAGVPVNASLLGQGASSPFADKSETFRLRSTGRAGDVTKTLDVVLRATKILPTVPTPGRIVHWREE
jgi:general secretion pathway protein K